METINKYRKKHKVRELDYEQVNRIFNMSNTKNRATGIDVGTMFFQVAEEGEGGMEILRTRNAFVELEVSEDIEEILGRNDWQYVKDGGKFFVIGEDSLRVANMFPGKVELRRPLADGVLNKGEEKKMLVLNELIKSAIGTAPSNKSVVCTCVSSDSADGSPDSAFHKARLMGMFKNLGWNVKVIEEGHAVILSERPVLNEPDGTESPFSGIGISFGAGRVNCVLAYKGLQVVGMSAARCGDWIDAKVAEATGEPLSQITKKKETKLNFDDIDYDDDVIFALDAYYGEMIRFVFKNFASKFQEVKSQFEAPLEVVLAGGTSTPQGFCKKVEEVIRELELPFEIKSVKLATEPRDAVVKGCLTQAIITQRKLEKSDPDNIESALE